MTDYIGQQLGKYRITQLLGTGGFAEVYLGVHVHLGTEAAIKLLHTQLATPAEIEKFRQEARTIASLTHPNIVRVLDFDVEGTTPYLVMDYAPNGSLRQYLSGRPLAPAEILPYLAQVADALQYAHEKKLVHRDIKPENMLLGRRNEVLLSDFGIATVAQSTTSQKTEGVAGTAAYMAPEQIQGKPRPSSDLYSLAVIVYEWLAGERPFQGTFTEVATQHLFAPPPPLHEKVPTISPLVEQVVLTALAKNPKDRFGTVRAFANAFAQASRADTSISLLSTQAGPAAPGSQPGITVTAASQLTPQVTPQFTPPAALPSAPGAAAAAPANVTPDFSAAPTVISSVPEQLGNQVGPSVLFSPTQLIVPAAPISPLPSGTGPHAAVATPPSFPAGLTVPEAPGSGPYQPQGWAPAPAAPGSVPFGNQGGSGPAALVLAPPAAPGAMPGGKPRRGMRVALIVLAAVLALAVVGGAGAYGLALVLHSSTGHPGSTAATVTITPAKSDVSNTFNITAVTGTPDSSQNQVAARQLSVATQPYSQTVNASGQQTTPGSPASGTLIAYNFDTVNPLFLSPGDLFQNISGCTPSSLQVVIDGNLNLPAASSPGTYTTGTVPGHVNQAGSGGNFPFAAFHTLLSPRSPATPLSGCASFGYTSGTCGSTYCWGIFNQGPFTGGTDPQTYPVVTQSDIDNATNSIIQAHQPDAQQLLQGQIQSNEQLVGTAQCTHQVSSDHNAGDQASQVTVTVTFTCTGEAYDYGGALTLAETLLKNQAGSNPGAGYALVGKINRSQVSATPGSGGSVAIVVSAEGIWVYQFSDSQKQDLANQIAGKSRQDAISFLASQTGVAQVSIDIASGDGQTLPTQPSQITITVQTVSGL